MASRIIEVRPTKAKLINLISQENYCDVCQKHLKNHGAKQFHMRKSHNQHIASMDTAMGLTNIRAGDPTTETRFFCPIQNCRSNQAKCFKSSKLLVQHFQKTHYAKQFKCENCPAKFALERDLRYHNNKNCPHRKKLDTLNDDDVQKADSNPSKKQQSVSVQTEQWLIPKRFIVLGHHNDIKPRKKVLLKSISIQTESCQNNEKETIMGQRNNYYFPCCTHQMDQVEQVQMATATEPIQTDFQQYQHSYAQTIYPQTIDFGAQYPTSGTTNYGQIYFEPLQVASTQTTQPHQSLDPISDGIEGSFRHCETQTPPAELNPWNSLEMTTVAAQTETFEYHQQRFEC